MVGGRKRGRLRGWMPEKRSRTKREGRKEVSAHTESDKTDDEGIVGWMR